MSDAPIPGGPGDMDGRCCSVRGFGMLPQDARHGLALSVLAQQANLPQDPAQLGCCRGSHVHAGRQPALDMAEDIARVTVRQAGIPGTPEPNVTSAIRPR